MVQISKASSYVCMLELALISGWTLVVSNGVSNEEFVNKCKTEIKNTGINATDVDKFGTNSVINRTEDCISWQKALDSIKTEGAVKKAYMQGQQAVRDSLKLAAKTR